MELTCDHSGPLEWTFNHHAPPQNAVPMKGNKLLVKDLELSNTGSYECTSHVDRIKHSSQVTVYGEILLVLL